MVAFTKGLVENDYRVAAASLGVEVAAIKAVASVESRGSGFILDAKAQAYVPQILFERHKMYSGLVKRGISVANRPADIVNKRSGGYIGGLAEHTRLDRAVQIHRETALESASYGMFQIMGFNWKVLGYKSIQDMINNMYKDEAAHLDAFVRFIKADARLLRALKSKDWATFARIYNGPNYAVNKYDTKMAQAYKKFS